MKLDTLPRNSIYVAKDRFRKNFHDLKALADSIAANGIIQPLAVVELADPITENGSTYKYKLIAGERRFRASAFACIADLPCQVYSQDTDSIQIRIIELEENLCREDMTWQEKVQAKRAIHELYEEQIKLRPATEQEKEGRVPEDWSIRKTAAKLKEDQANLTREINLARAMDEIPELKDAKNKSDAMKMLSGIMERMTQAELASRSLAEITKAKPGQDPMLVAKNALIQSYVLGDFFEEVKKLPKGSFNFAEVDPPYAINLQEIRKADGFNTGMHSKEDYNEIDVETYPEFLCKLFSSLYEVMADNSWVLVWYAIHPWHYQIISSLQEAGFDPCPIPLMWIKGAGQTNTPNTRLANTWEPAIYAQKGKPLLAKPGRLNCFPFTGVSPSKRIHPTERPIGLMTEVVNTFCMEGFKVIVPFAGSGNTLLAVANLQAAKGLSGVGFDLSKTYRDAYVNRVFASPYGDYSSV